MTIFWRLFQTTALVYPHAIGSIIGTNIRSRRLCEILHCFNLDGIKKITIYFVLVMASKNATVHLLRIGDT